jgi:hypothetical protein
VTLEQQLVAAHDAAVAHAETGERVAAVMAAEPGRSARVYLAAFERDGGLTYLALDGELAPLDDRRLIREAVVMLGLAERAEEASAAVAADEIAAAFGHAERALRAGGHEPVAAAAADVCAAARALADAASGPRVATPVYLDSIGAASGPLAVALLGFRDLLEQLTPDGDRPPAGAEPGWTALAVAGRAGDPADFAQAMTATTGAVEALADDVLANLRAV